MTTPMAEGDRSATLDDVISAVADEHRRVVLRLLTEAEGERIRLDALVDGVIERIDGGDRPTAERRSRVRIALHQIHLPKLDACGLVRYDVETKQVQGTPGALCEDILTLINTHEAAE
ncbi:hypothetical protein HWV23_15685 [Natronomonas halophila]|uniref:DUF7344 domain-containing protein n=1 Tax=Natronomonas halophila TaxID=2747817 RepID=UPI0015B527B5|nr:hypothetical protein [Natronomonas halophila]QLD87103.1 hypothetical protein HWV23_15685 [Natronomonas halophila]